jgi:hypothetical protein
MSLNGGLNVIGVKYSSSVLKLTKQQSTTIQWSKNNYIIDNMLIYFEHLMKKFGGFYPKKFPNLS